MALAVRKNERRWPRWVAFKIDATIAAADVPAVHEALLRWEAQTIYRFAPHAGEADWIEFRKDREANDSHIGRPPARGARVINLQTGVRVQSVVHEIGHALGLDHEQNRLDRDRHVIVHWDRIQEDSKHNFAKQDDEYIDVGPYDFDSTMHYGSTLFARKLAGDKWSTTGWTGATFYEVGGKTFGLFAKSGDGTVHICPVAANGELGATIHKDTWGTTGWTTVEAFRAGGSPFLFSLKEGDGTVHVNRIEADGNIGARVDQRTWSAGWTDVSFFQAGGSTHVLLLKTATGAVSVHRFNADGTIGPEVDQRSWSSDWTSVVAYMVGGAPFLLALKQSTGDVDIHSIDAATGNVGALVEHHRWQPGWTDVAFYPGGPTGTCLLLLNSSTGKVDISRMNADGKVGGQVEVHAWGPSWSIAVPFSPGAAHCVFFYKDDGEVSIHQLETTGQVGASSMIPTLETRIATNMARIDAPGNGLSKFDAEGITAIALGNVDVAVLDPSGKPGRAIDRREWSDGWTQAVPYTSGGKQFLFFLKEETGAVDIHEVAAAVAAPATWSPTVKRVAAGEIGSLVKHYDWARGWSSACFFSVGGVTYLFLIKASDGVVSINQVEADGTIGAEVVRDDWSSGWKDATTFEAGGAPYLLLVKEDGEVSISELLVGGRVGRETFRETWTEGWTTATTYVAGATPYLLLIKEQGGDASVSELLPGGIVGREVMRETWTSGWTHALPFTAGGNQFMLSLKSATGHVEVNPILADGTLGARSHQEEWRPGWTTLATYQAGGSSVLLALRRGKVKVKDDRPFIWGLPLMGFPM